MKQIYLLASLAIWFSIIMAAGLLLYPRLKSFALSAVAVLLSICLGFFFVEHYHGLGNLSGLMPLAFVASLALIYWRRQYLAAAQDEVYVFIACFMFGLLWRMLMPNLDGGSEKLTNLNLLVSYRQGETLPPQDMWLGGHALTMYYGFQHYSAALMGRMMHFTIGYNYHFAFATVLGLVGMTAWGSLRLWDVEKKNLWLRVLIIIALIAGGTGIAPLTGLLFPDADAGTRLWANVRFIGIYEQNVGDFGRQLFTSGPKGSGPDLPIETIGYFLHLGDFHAVLGGFFLSSLLCLLFSYLIKNNFKAPATASVLLGAVMVLPLAMNVWIFPLVVVLVALFAYKYRAQIDWRAMLVGIVGTAVLLQPFLSYFLNGSLPVRISEVAAGQHTPGMQFFLLAWPLLVFIAFGLFAKDKSGWLRWLALFCLAVLVWSEFFYINESPTGSGSRFNTALKWWSWLYAMALVGIGGKLVASSSQAWARYGAAAVAALISLHVLDLGRLAMNLPREARGDLSGENWIRGVKGKKELLDYLKEAPKGILLENGGFEAYNQQSAMGLLSNKPNLAGWLQHEAQWRGNPPFLQDLAQDIGKFYSGQHPFAREWLNFHKVRYVIVTERKMMDAYTQKAIDEQIKADYDWQGFGASPLIGVWVRKN